MRVESLQHWVFYAAFLRLVSFSTLHAGRVAATPASRGCRATTPLSVPSMRVESLQPLANGNNTTFPLASFSTLHAGRVAATPGNSAPR